MGVGSFGGSRSFRVRSSPLTAVAVISDYKKSVYVLRRQALRGMTRGDMHARKRSSSLSLRRNRFVSELENLSRYKTRITVGGLCLWGMGEQTDDEIDPSQRGSPCLVTTCFRALLRTDGPGGVQLLDIDARSAG